MDVWIWNWNIYILTLRGYTDITIIVFIPRLTKYFFSNTSNQGWSLKHPMNLKNKRLMYAYLVPWYNYGFPFSKHTKKIQTFNVWRHNDEKLADFFSEQWKSWKTKLTATAKPRYKQNVLPGPVKISCALIMLPCTIFYVFVLFFVLFCFVCWFFFYLFIFLFCKWPFTNATIQRNNVLGSYGYV